MAEAVIDMPKVTMNITMRMPRAYRLRMWAVTMLLRLAGAIGPHDITIEIQPND